MIEGNPERKHIDSTDTTMLMRPEEIPFANRVAQNEPGIQVEVFPKTTDQDREVAASAFALAAELSGSNTVNPDNWHRQAKEGMDIGWSVVRITTEQLPDEEAPNSSRFFRALGKLEKQKDKPDSE